VEVSALKSPASVSALRGPSPLLRLQSDERLIALTRRGQHEAFEALFSRYNARLLSFCRHMLGSREDAEDVLQEVFVAAFNAVLADERAINARPWLYRIARNRSLNHLRRASAIGVDSMDIHFAEGGISTGEKVMRRESFRQLIGDVQQLPETQRTALLLREIDALSYDQIAHAMETTVPSVKSLLVRARISLAEAAEARRLSCAEVRTELGEVAEGLIKITPPARRHLRDCERCRGFRKHLKDNNHALAAILPVTPLLLLKRLILTKFGASAGAGHVAGAGGAGAAAGAGTSAGAAAGAGTAAGAGAASGAGAAGGLITAGAGAIATKAAATLAAAALVTAGAVAADHTGRAVRRHPAAVAAAHSAALAQPAMPLVVRSSAQPVTSGARVVDAAAIPGAHHRSTGSAGGRNRGPGRGERVLALARTKGPVNPTPAGEPKPQPTSATLPPPPTVEVTTETTALAPAPSTVPAAPQPGAGTTTAASAPATTPVAATPAGESQAPPAAGEAEPTESTETQTPAAGGAPATETPEPGSEGAGAGTGTTQASTSVSAGSGAAAAGGEVAAP
jgi:RNA polymerase sigma factor (sigma-70 family)